MCDLQAERCLSKAGSYVDEAFDACEDVDFNDRVDKRRLSDDRAHESVVLPSKVLSRGKSFFPVAANDCDTRGREDSSFCEAIRRQLRLWEWFLPIFVGYPLSTGDPFLLLPLFFLFFSHGLWLLLADGYLHIPLGFHSGKD